jgi:hypothetical protein
MELLEFSEGLPFFEDYLASSKDNELQYQVETILKTQSNKGYLLITERFCYFIWKTDKAIQAVLRILEEAEKNKKQAPGIFLVRRSKTETKLRIGLERETLWFYEKKGKGGYSLKA